ncbi:MAG: DUF4350 domain-containing protein [Deltaproteobacteria bacterium]|nr:DUF4350 domain-containing protein [Deltaproteobacteria bacterium]
MTSPFSRGAVIASVAVVAVSIAVAVVLSVIGGDFGDKRSAGPDGYSQSAIGHRGLVEMLRRLDVPVIVSRSASGDKAGDGLLVIAEPTIPDATAAERLRGMIARARRVLVVLPKWYGEIERGKTWIDDANLRPPSEIQDVLRVIEADAVLERRDAPGAWTSQLGARPRIREPQLLVFRSAAIEGPVRSEGALLVAKLDEKVAVLSDPDVLSNHGLRAPENARFTVALIDELRAGGPVVFDETLHGYAQQPSLLRTLFTFPLVIATTQVLLCALLVVWAAMVRFGPRRALPPPLAPGKDFLIRNTAALLQYGGHHAHALRRYLASTIAVVRTALHAPSLGPAAMTAWLERVRANTHGTISLLDLETSVAAADTPARVVEVADLIYRWRMEMTHGTRSRS